MEGIGVEILDTIIPIIIHAVLRMPSLYLEFFPNGIGCRIYEQALKERKLSIGKLFSIEALTSKSYATNTLLNGSTITSALGIGKNPETSVPLAPLSVDGIRTVLEIPNLELLAVLIFTDKFSHYSSHRDLLSTQLAWNPFLAIFSLILATV